MHPANEVLVRSVPSNIGKTLSYVRGEHVGTKVLTPGTNHTYIREEGVPLICVGPIDCDLPALTQMLLLCSSRDWFVYTSSTRGKELRAGLEEVRKSRGEVGRTGVFVDQVDDDRLCFVVACSCPGHSNSMLIAEPIVPSDRSFIA
jgi:hypothetical protein